MYRGKICMRQFLCDKFGRGKFGANPSEIRGEMVRFPIRCVVTVHGQAYNEGGKE